MKKSICFWWVVSNVPMLGWVSYANSYGPFTMWEQSFFTNAAIWGGWILFWGGMWISERRHDH